MLPDDWQPLPVHRLLQEGPQRGEEEQTGHARDEDLARSQDSVGSC